MKRLHIIVEGETEEKFLKEILFPFLPIKNTKTCSKIKQTRGGLINYEHLKKDILNCINQSNILLTTMIDFYGMPENFPNFEKCQNKKTTDEKIKCLQQGIYDDISNNGEINYTDTFIPHIAKYEFEALVFSDKNILKEYFGENEINQAELNKVINIEPEEINNSKKTAPSKKLKKIVTGYNKINDGIAIIEKIGLNKVLQKCPHFKNWIEKIKEKLTE